MTFSWPWALLSLLVIPLLWGSLRLPTLTVMGVVIVLAVIQLLIAAFSSLL